MISRNIKRDDKPRIPSSSNDKIRGNCSKSVGAGEPGIEMGVLREFEGKVVGAEGILLKHITENFSVRDRAAGREDGSKLNISDINASKFVSPEPSTAIGNRIGSEDSECLSSERLRTSQSLLKRFRPHIISYMMQPIDQMSTLLL